MTPRASCVRVGVTHGLRGYFAFLFDDQGPIQSGPGSYADPAGAWQEAREWAQAEGLPLAENAPNIGPAMSPRSAPRRPDELRPYTGIGSRETPADILALMTRTARCLAELGYLLRSGAAIGADTAFEAGADAREIFLPWEGFQQRSAKEPGVFVTADLPCAAAAEALAAEHHPAWPRLSQGARRLHTRNATQVLGPALDAPSSFVLCWAREHRMEGGRVVDVSGGTGLAVRLAHQRRIPIFHLGLPEHRERIERWLERAAPTHPGAGPA